MIVAIAVVGIMAMLTVYVGQNALHQLSTTATDRQRTTTVDSAEGGVDLAVSQMQAATTLTGSTGLPCGIPGSLSTAPTTASYTVSVTYYSSTGANLSTAGCPAPSLTSETYYTGTTTPISALIFSQGASNSKAYGAQAMEAQVQLSGTSGAIGTNAIYSGGAMTWKDGVQASDPGGKANIYSGGDFGCTLTPGTTAIQGSIVVQGSITTAQPCNTTGNWSVLNYVNDPAGSTVGGSITAAAKNATYNCGAGFTTASVCLSGNGSVGAIDARTTVDNVKNEPHGTITSGDSGLTGPQTQAFPQLNFVSSNWAGAGWKVITEANNGCTQAQTDVAAMSSASQPTVIYVPGTCQMWWNSALSLSLAQNLAVVSEGGFYFQGNVTVTAGSSASKLFLISPYATGDGGTGGTNACGTPPSGGGNPNWPSGNQTPGLYVGGTFSAPTSNNFQTLFYVPCSIYMPNGMTSDYAQIYAGGSMLLDHQFTFNYQAAQIPGYGSSGNGLFNVSLLYKRQTTSPNFAPTTTTTSSTTTTTLPPLSGLAGLAFTSTSQTGSGTFTCGSVSQNVTCTATKLTATGHFTGSVTMETSTGTTVTNDTGSPLTITSSETTVTSPGGTVSPASSTIANGSPTTAGAFTLTGLGGGWKATMTCSLVYNGVTYTIAVTGSP